MKPLAIDLFCGLGGWTEGLLAEGYDVVGFDIERRPYPAQLVIQDVLTLHGLQFRDAALIVASPPCQEYSYMAMPWSRAKKIAAEYRLGVRDVAKLKALFYACIRIQIEASNAARRYIPLVIENVKGAQPWVGPAKANFGSFYLWGDVGMVGRRVVARAKFGEGVVPVKAVKVAGLNWSGSDKPGYVARAFNGTAVARMRSQDGLKLPGNNAPRRWDERRVQRLADGLRYEADSFYCASSGSAARKAASAAIAKIPFPLAQHIARAYYPHVEALV